jgi:hypothetical protein
LSEGARDRVPALGSEDPGETARYLAQVMAEIDEEVQRRRSSGDLPERVERDLDELFLRHSPVAGRDGSLEEALGLVESSGYVDPVVPVLSSKSGGALAKRAIRQASLWYMGWVTDQVNHFTTATARALRLLDDRVLALQRQYADYATPAAPTLELPWAHGPEAWWVPTAIQALAGRSGRMLHAAAGDGWLVRKMVEAGLDAYGVEPREGKSEHAEVEGVDLREEPVVDHLRAVPVQTLAGLVLSGVVDGMTAAERDAIVRQVTLKLAPGGRLVLHSLTEAAWFAPEAPIEADLASGRPLRPQSWVHLLGALGFPAEVVLGPDGRDYLVLCSAPETSDRGHRER